MGQVTVTVNGRSYRLRCGDGEESRLLELAAHVRDRIETLVSEFGQAGDERLTVMAALLITDELFDAKSRIDVLERELEVALIGSQGKQPARAK